MKNLTAYIIAEEMKPDQDLIMLGDNRIYFNLADAKEMASQWAEKGKRYIFKILLPYPQDGTGVIVESDTDLFDQFWAAYPRHIAKKNALKSWTRLKVTTELFTKIMTALEAVKRTQQWQDVQYVPHPATWLNQERWEDEVDASRPKVLPSDDKYAGL